MEMNLLEALAFDGLRAAIQLAHKTATDAGWYRDPVTGAPKERNFGEVVALMHSELSEALEADRKNLADDKLPLRPGVEVEFGDLFLRVGDTAAARGDDIPNAFIEVQRLLQRYSVVEIRWALLMFRMFAESGEGGHDLAGATIEKNRFNVTRADHKLENRAAGGKRY
jgi:hypothetical protein